MATTRLPDFARPTRSTRCSGLLATWIAEACTSHGAAALLSCMVQAFACSPLDMTLFEFTQHSCSRIGSSVAAHRSVYEIGRDILTHVRPLKIEFPLRESRSASLILSTQRCNVQT